MMEEDNEDHPFPLLRHPSLHFGVTCLHFLFLHIYVIKIICVPFPNRFHLTSSHELNFIMPLKILCEGDF